MKATHRGYLHPNCIRVEDGQRYNVWNAGGGSFQRTAVCMSPSCSDYQKLYKASLPIWRGDVIENGIARPMTEAEYQAAIKEKE